MEILTPSTTYLQRVRHSFVQQPIEMSGNMTDPILVVDGINEAIRVSTSGPSWMVLLCSVVADDVGYIFRWGTSYYGWRFRHVPKPIGQKYHHGTTEVNLFNMCISPLCLE